MALKGKYKNNEEFGKDLKTQKDPTYEERALLAFSIVETVVGQQLDEKVIPLFINEVSLECGQNPQDILKILVHLLSDNEYFQKIMKKYKAFFAKQEVVIPG